MGNARKHRGVLAMMISKAASETERGVIPLIFGEDRELTKSDFISRLSTKRVNWVFDQYKIL